MVEPEKPFACSMPDCGMTFTNEDHLHVHTKKHDMVLQFGMEQKAAFVADQTPTPTRFIRNCEEVGLFLDLQNDNPFEEGFKRAMETAKHGLPLPSMEHPPSTDDLHTPQMFPLIDQTDSALFTTNNQRNITISRSSSDESGAVKEYETTTISKLTNEVTTISRRVEKHDIDKLSDDTAKHTDRQKDISETSVSYTNNVIKIRKDNLVNVECSKNGQICYSDSVIKDVNIAKDILEVEKLQVPPIMSQKSIDLVVDSLTSEICKHPNVDDLKKETEMNRNDITSDIDGEYTVTITLPGGKEIKMKAVDPADTPKTVNNNTKEKLKNAINNKVFQPIPVVQNIPVGTLIPVTLIPQVVNKIPIVPLATDKDRFIKKPIKRRRVSKNGVSERKDDDCIIIEPTEKKKLSREDMNSRVAASRRYRVRLRETMNHQVSEISRLKESNQKLAAELATLKSMVIEHIRNCPNAADLRMPQQKPHVPENT